MSTSIFTLEDINFSYQDGKAVLENVNFSLHEKEKIALTGHNGSGKTTLLHLIMGLLHPVSGQVLYRGRPMQCEKDFRELRKGVGLLFQQADDQLFCPTVIEDVAFGPLNLGKTPEEALEISEKTLCMFGLSGYNDRVAYRLSGGEKKLVSLAAGMAMQPQALVLDEPTNDLDPAMRNKLINVLNALDIAMLVVSHDLDFLKHVTEAEYSCRDNSLFKGSSDFHSRQNLKDCKT